MPPPFGICPPFENPAYASGYNSTSIVMFTCFYCYLSSAVIFSYLFVTAKAALPKKSLVFAARQIANNLSPIAKKL